jgi:hypothetical protein
MSKELTVNLTDKGFVPADPQNSKFFAYITVAVIITNNTSKDIRAFKGTMVFKTILGTDIHKVGFEYDQPLSAGKSATYKAAMKYNEFRERDVRLLNTNLADIKFDFVPVAILFTDGTHLGDIPADDSQ